MVKLYIKIDKAYDEGNMLLNYYTDLSSKSNTRNDSGIDLIMPDDYSLSGGESKLLNFGISCQPEDNEQGYTLVSRSSTFKKTGCILTNSVGTIDAGYTGHLMANVHKVVVAEDINSRMMCLLLVFYVGLLRTLAYSVGLILVVGVHDYFVRHKGAQAMWATKIIEVFFPKVFKKSERYFQLVAADMRPIDVEVVEEFPRKTERGAGAYGSTDTVITTTTSSDASPIKLS